MARQRSIQPVGSTTRKWPAGGAAVAAGCRDSAESLKIIFAGGWTITFPGELQDEFPVAGGLPDSVGEGVAEDFLQAGLFGFALQWQVGNQVGRFVVLEAILDQSSRRRFSSLASTVQPISSKMRK